MFDDGSFFGKLVLDIFIIVLEKLGFRFEECVVIEDVFLGFIVVKKVGVGKIIVIDLFGKNCVLFEEK